jgi:hypothetical protein
VDAAQFWQLNSKGHNDQKNHPDNSFIDLHFNFAVTAQIW